VCDPCECVPGCGQGVAIKKEVAAHELLTETEPLVDESSKSTIFTDVLAQVTTRMTGANISSGTVVVLLKYAMEAVELTEVTGAEQRELVLDIVRRVISDAPLPDDVEAACMNIIDSGVLVGVVDLVVDATKGRVSVNRVAKKAKRCILKCMQG
jgi:hypothetical protein